MQNRRWVWIAAWVGSFAVFAAGVAYLVTERRSESAAASADQLPDLAAMPFPASLSTLGTSSIGIGDQMMIGVEANTGKGVDSISLYDGARRVLTTAADPGLSTATLRYRALSVGPHALYVKVADEAGRETLSAVTEVEVSEAAPPQTEVDPATGSPIPMPAAEAAAAAAQPVVIDVDPEPDETTKDVADRLGVKPGQVDIEATGADDKPVEVAAGDPIPPGARVFVRVPRNNGAKDARVPVITPSAGGGGLAIAGQVGTEGCKVTLSAKGANGKVAFYEGSASAPGWAKVGRPDGDLSVTIRSLTPGAHAFIARDSSGAQSAPISIAAPQSCRQGTGWSGTAAIVNGNLLIPGEVAGGRTYLYLRIGAQSYRIPSGQDDYFSTGTVTPISTYLPRISGQTLDLEVWSDKSSAQFSKKASGRLTVPDGETITSIVGEPSGLRLAGRVKGKLAYESAITLGDQDKTLDMRWVSASTRVTRVMWQVLLDDRSSTDHRLSPGDLLASGTSDVSDTGAFGTSGHFAIDSAMIPGRAPEKAKKGEVAKPGTVPGPKVVKLPYTPGDISKIAKNTVATVPKTVDLSNVEQPVLRLPTFGDTVHIRVVALSDDVAGANSSSTVPLKLPVPDGVNGKPVDMVVTDATYDAGAAANPLLNDCVRLAVPWTSSYSAYKQAYQTTVFPELDLSSAAIASENLKPYAPLGGWTKDSAQLSQTYSHSQTKCPDRTDPDAECDGFFDCLADSVGALYAIAKSLVAEVVDLYNGAINFVVESIVKYSGLCQIIGSASGSKGAQSTCKTVLTVATKAAIGIVLASVGLPVSLPSVDDLERAAQGEIAAVLVSMADQLGLPCSAMKTADPKDVQEFGSDVGVDTSAAAVAADPCLAMANALVGSIRSQVVADTSAATAASGPWPNVSGIEGASLIPEPRGRPTAQTLGITVKVKDANAQIPEDLVCGAIAQVNAPANPTVWLTSVLQLQPVDPDRRTWSAKVSSVDYYKRNLSPWSPMNLGGGVVLNLANEGIGAATFTTPQGLTLLKPGGDGLTFSGCLIDGPVTRTDTIDTQ